MDHLAGLTEETRKLALDRFRLLQPHLEDGRPLKAVEAAAEIPFRSAQRCGEAVPAVPLGRAGAKEAGSLPDGMPPNPFSATRLRRITVRQHGDLIVVFPLHLAGNPLRPTFDDGNPGLVENVHEPACLPDVVGCFGSEPEALDRQQIRRVEVS